MNRAHRRDLLRRMMLDPHMRIAALHRFARPTPFSFYHIVNTAI